LSHVLREIKNTIWAECIEKNRVADINNFADRILELSREYKDPQLAELAQNLSYHTDKYDLHHINIYLKEFADLIEQYEG
jgi:hypothetical protein